MGKVSGWGILEDEERGKEDKPYEREEVCERMSERVVPRMKNEC